MLEFSDYGWFFLELEKREKVFCYFLVVMNVVVVYVKEVNFWIVI